LKKPCLHARAFAKVNAGLWVLARRPDGYHEIRTIYQTIGLHDDLEVSLDVRGRGVAFECDTPGVPRGKQNLVVRAAELWKRARKFRGGIRVRLGKRIPMGSGLGGASSDAAATLVALERLAGERLDAERLAALAAALGSDVPFFLTGGRAAGAGRGELISPLPDGPRRRCLVAFPGFSVSTREAYAHLSRTLTKERAARKMERFGAWPPKSPQVWGPAENDFERYVFARWPELARVKRRLLRAGAEFASLTGSGSALFAFFDSAQSLLRGLECVPAGWQVWKTRTLSRAEFRRRTVVSDE
jgi:4-diphosphocytidyl-2-C-methyl-D-erythritol kinase